MDWLIHTQQRHQEQISFLNKMTKITLYDNNEILRTDLENLTFSCVLNCKRLNRQYSILGKVEGDLYTHVIQISCALLGYNCIVTGRWQYQKIQLTKFAYRYNQKLLRVSQAKRGEQTSFYQIKVNPLSGQFYVCCHFIFGYDLINDYQKFKRKITDQCQRLTSESQKIFNTILLIIFDEETNDPYLKSEQKISIHSTYQTNFNLLLNRVKKMDAISNHYKIKQDIASQNKYRSAFKKVFLKKSQKCLHNQLIIENAMLFTHKFCRKHVDAIVETGQVSKKKNAIIAPFEDLDDNLQLEYANKYLYDFSKSKTGESIIELNNLSSEDKTMLSQPGIHNMGGFIIQVQVIGKEKKIYEYELINKLNFKYCHMAQYFHIKGEQFINLRITEYIEQIPLGQYLQRNASSLSLSTILDIMIQICHTIQILHKFNIGYFLQIKNIYIVDGVIKIKDFTTGYSLCNWDQIKQKDKDFLDKKYLMGNYKEYLLVCGYVKNQENQSRDKMEEEKERDKSKFQNERADIFSLGMVLYRVLMGKFPFQINCISILELNYQKVQEILDQMWTVETQFFLRQGGMVVKLLGHLLLKCLYLQVEKRPYVEWLVVILSEVKSSIQCLY